LQLKGATILNTFIPVFLSTNSKGSNSSERAIVPVLIVTKVSLFVFIIYFVFYCDKFSLLVFKKLLCLAFIDKTEIKVIKNVNLFFIL
jgi:hypothetical protein